jgi:hypothetical protein
MSDARTQAIHKAASELQEELIAATGQNGGERWYHLIVRKMEQLIYEKEPRTTRQRASGDGRTGASVRRSS